MEDPINQSPEKRLKEIEEKGFWHFVDRDLGQHDIAADHWDWLIARVKRLEEALESARSYIVVYEDKLGEVINEHNVIAASQTRVNIDEALEGDDENLYDRWVPR